MGNLRKDNLVRHHLLELILWPNEDGTFTQIRNSVARLKELGIYDDWKMTITISNSEHWTLHHKGKVLTNTTKEKIGKASKGHITSDEQKRKISEAHKGKPLSEYHRQKLREAWVNRRAKKIRSLNHG